MGQTTITLSKDVKRHLRRLKPDDLTWDEFLELLQDSLDVDAFEAEIRERYAGAVRAARTGTARSDLLSKLPGSTDPDVADALQRFLDRLDDEAGGRVEQILLYGSVARGEADENSDVDLLVVWDGDAGTGRDLVQDLAHEIHRERLVHLSAKVVDSDTWQDKAGWSFHRTVRQEGIRLA